MVVYSELKKLPQQRVVKEYINSVVIDVCLVCVGLVISFTGILAVLGVPMILYGLIDPLLHYWMLKNKARTGECPYCHSDIFIEKIKPGITCKVCKKRSVIKDEKIYSVE